MAMARIQRCYASHTHDGEHEEFELMKEARVEARWVAPLPGSLIVLPSASPPSPHR